MKQMTGQANADFYPRSPCGERPRKPCAGSGECCISIHALLAESDQVKQTCQAEISISIHALLAESDFPINVMSVSAVQISIHALLAESDAVTTLEGGSLRDFYPRSPCGERRKSNKLAGEKLVFLSTLSLRRATMQIVIVVVHALISIHALLAESDPPRITPAASRRNFYPRSPCGERHECWTALNRLSRISIHALLAESDTFQSAVKKTIHSFLSTLSLRRATFQPH